MAIYDKAYPGEVCPAYRIQPDPRSEEEKALGYLKSQEELFRFYDDILSSCREKNGNAR